MGKRTAYLQNWDKGITEEHRVRLRRNSVVGRFRTTPEWYDAKLKEQHGHCVLCEAKQGDANKRLHIDHDHTCCGEPITLKRACGKCNRGLLCGPCNRRLAAVEDVLTMGEIIPKWDTWLSKALKYLDSYKGIALN
jgi:hypothetical protein